MEKNLGVWAYEKDINNLERNTFLGVKETLSFQVMFVYGLK